MLGEESRRGSFTLYALGLLEDEERKSVKPLAAQACPGPERVDAMHPRLLHFTVDTTWSGRQVRRVAAQYALEDMTRREPVEVWIVDDTGFLKQGKHSVGVQRQYTGSAGNVANCQMGVSLREATRTEHLPLDFERYPPECWANDAARRREARLPANVPFKTKPQLALKMIDRAVEDRVPPGVILADTAYGSCSQFRAHLCSRGLHSAVAVGPPQTTVCLLNEKGRPRGDARSASDLALRIHERGGFRRCTGARAPRRAYRRALPCGVSLLRASPSASRSRWDCSLSGATMSPSPPISSSFLCRGSGRRSSSSAW